MKKILQILFVSIYLFSTIGLTVAYHFCGNTLVFTAIVLSSSLKEPNDCCGESEQENECCHNQFKSYKLDDLHFASAKNETGNPYTDIVDYPQSTIENYFISQSLNQFLDQTHSPPGEDAYLINRVLRV